MGLFYLCLCSNSPSELQPHSKEILALRGWEGEKKRAAVRAGAFRAALLVVSTAAVAAKIDKWVNG